MPQPFPWIVLNCTQSVVRDLLIYPFQPTGTKQGWKRWQQSEMMFWKLREKSKKGSSKNKTNRMNRERKKIEKEIDNKKEKICTYII